MLLAAEKQAKALKARLLESTEVAARAILEETRAEGDRRIDGATRQAEAIATTVSEIENAEQALTDRARTFAAASKALRAELESFAATLSDGERRLSAGAGEHEPQLVTSGASEEVEEPDYGDLDADLAVEDEDVDLSAPASNVSEAENEKLAEEGKSDYDYEADGDGPIDDDGDDGESPIGEEDDRPTLEFERPYDLKEDVSPRGRKRGERSKLKRFFMGLEKTTDTAAHQPQDVLPVLGTVRYSRRDRLAVELGGALISLGGTLALLRFVLLD